MISEPDFDAIERYLCHAMTSQERVAFEKRMHGDPALRDAVEEVDALIKGIEMAVMKEKMNSFHEQLDKPETPGQKNIPHPNTRMLQSFSTVQYMVAASFLLLLAISVWWFATQRPPHLKLYAAYFAPDPGLITPMSADADYTFYTAMVDYKLHDYDKAISKWESLLPHKPESDTLNYFIGVAELARGNADTAIPFLQHVTKQSDSPFWDDAFFYLGMAHLKLGQLEDAAASLENTSNQRGLSVLDALKKKRLVDTGY